VVQDKAIPNSVAVRPGSSLLSLSLLPRFAIAASIPVIVVSMLGCASFVPGHEARRRNGPASTTDGDGTGGDTTAQNALMGFLVLMTGVIFGVMRRWQTKLEFCKLSDYLEI
jgi:hypothetical protein